VARRLRNPFFELMARGRSLLRLLVVAVALAAHGSLLVHEFEHTLHPAEEAGDCTLCQFASTALPEPDADPVPARPHAESIQFVSQGLDSLASAFAHSRPPPRAPPILISA